MMGPDPKKIVAALFLKKKPDGGTGDESDDSGSPVEAASQDVLDAIKSGSAKDLAEALKSVFDILDQPEDGDDEK